MAVKQKMIRIIIGKIGCDIHERGTLVLARAFRDAGMEVIYLGRFQTADAIAKTAVDEDANIIALSDHTGSMRYIADQMMEALKKYKGTDIPVIAGGLIAKKDLPYLEKLGVTGNFGPGTPLPTIIEHIRKTVEMKQAASD
ncbi:MAG: cobalamin-dependent protein [Dehalococcoidia bacterium]|jgi:methylmalonyl-CoA mutase C-terminal domain/subunit|nr:cobalamin-dependent protein [Dehalococcoidia bacterium]